MKSLFIFFFFLFIAERNIFLSLLKTISTFSFNCRRACSREGEVQIHLRRFGPHLHRVGRLNKLKLSIPNQYNLNSRQMKKNPTSNVNTHTPLYTIQHTYYIGHYSRSLFKLLLVLL